MRALQTLLGGHLCTYLHHEVEPEKADVFNVFKLSRDHLPAHGKVGSVATNLG